MRSRGYWSTTRAVVFLLLSATWSLGVTTAAAQADSAEARRCLQPSDNQDFETRGAAESGFDGAELNKVVNEMVGRYGGTVEIFRYGCRVATNSHVFGGRGAWWESFSVAKSLTSVAVARAIELGYLTLDDRLGAFLTEADFAHGDLTIRNLLQQNTGVHWNFIRDYNLINDDHLNNFLTLPFDYRPGSKFEYAQVPVSAVAEVVARASKRPFADFIRKEVLAKLGISPDQVDINLDRTGRTDAYWGIRMAPSSWSRVASLIMQDGKWSGQRLLDSDWIRELKQPSASNGCYSLLFWVNASEPCERVRILVKNTTPTRFMAFAPTDALYMMGTGGQTVTMIPSLNLVVTRFGPPIIDAGVGWSVPSELLHKVLSSIVNPAGYSPGPMAAVQRVEDRTQNIFASLFEGEHVAAALQSGLPKLPPAGPIRVQLAELGDVLGLRTFRKGSKIKRVAEIVASCSPNAQVSCVGNIDIAVSGRALNKQYAYEIEAGSKLVLKLKLSRREIAKLRAFNGLQVRLSTVDGAGETRAEKWLTLGAR